MKNRWHSYYSFPRSRAVHAVAGLLLGVMLAPLTSITAYAVIAAPNFISTATRPASVMEGYGVAKTPTWWGCKFISPFGVECVVDFGRKKLLSDAANTERWLLSTAEDPE